MDANFWKERAEEARQIASSVTDHAERVNMLIVAMGYERMAELAHKRAPTCAKIPISSSERPDQKAR